MSTVVVIAIIAALALLSGGLILWEVFAAANHRISRDLREQDRKFPRRHLRSVDE